MASTASGVSAPLSHPVDTHKTRRPAESEWMIHTRPAAPIHGRRVSQRGTYTPTSKKESQHVGGRPAATQSTDEPRYGVYFPPLIPSSQRFQLAPCYSRVRPFPPFAHCMMLCKRLEKREGTGAERSSVGAWLWTAKGQLQLPSSPGGLEIVTTFRHIGR